MQIEKNNEKAPNNVNIVKPPNIKISFTKNAKMVYTNV